MCYSAQIRADYGRFVRHHGATVSLKDFYRLYWLRQNDPRVKVPRALDVAFLRDPAAAELHPLIHAHAAAEATRLEQELFAQRTRQAKAERTAEIALIITECETLLAHPPTDMPVHGMRTILALASRHRPFVLRLLTAKSECACDWSLSPKNAKTAAPRPAGVA